MPFLDSNKIIRSELHSITKCKSVKINLLKCFNEEQNVGQFSEVDLTIFIC